MVLELQRSRQGSRVPTCQHPLALLSTACSDIHHLCPNEGPAIGTFLFLKHTLHFTGFPRPSSPIPSSHRALRGPVSFRLLWAVTASPTSLAFDVTLAVWRTGGYFVPLPRASDVFLMLMPGLQVSRGKAHPGTGCGHGPSPTMPPSLAGGAGQDPPRELLFLGASSLSLGRKSLRSAHTWAVGQRRPCWRAKGCGAYTELRVGALSPPFIRVFNHVFIILCSHEHFISVWSCILRTLFLFCGPNGSSPGY